MTRKAQAEGVWEVGGGGWGGPTSAVFSGGAAGAGGLSERRGSVPQGGLQAALYGPWWPGGAGPQGGQGSV